MVWPLTSSCRQLLCEQEGYIWAIFLTKSLTVRCKLVRKRSKNSTFMTTNGAHLSITASQKGDGCSGWHASPFSYVHGLHSNCCQVPWVAYQLLSQCHDMMQIQGTKLELQQSMLTKDSSTIWHEHTSLQTSWHEQWLQSSCRNLTCHIWVHASSDASCSHLQSALQRHATLHKVGLSKCCAPITWQMKLHTGNFGPTSHLHLGRVASLCVH